MSDRPRDRLEEGLERMREAMLRAERDYLGQLRRDGEAMGRAARELRERESLESLEALEPQPRGERDLPTRRPPAAPPARVARTREGRRMARQRARDHRRRHRRRHRHDARHAASGPSATGWVFVIIAAVMTLMVLFRGAPWWFLFIAIGLGVKGARELSPGDEDRGFGLPPGPDEAWGEDTEVTSEAASKRVPAGPPAPKAEHARLPGHEARTARLARVDAVCDRLVRDVREGPEVLREIVGDPKQTVEALRQSCHALARREAELLSLVTDADDARLAGEREQLVARLEAEQDPVVRERFGAALEALDDQLRQREELRTAAARLEAESTRLGYTLESLHAQVLRVRGADAASAEVAGAGLRHSVTRLGDELDAVAEALEWTARGDRGPEPEPGPDQR